MGSTGGFEYTDKYRGDFCEMELSELQAFKTMVLYLEKYYERTRSDDVGSLLGDLILLDDNSTADPAAWYDWMQCVKEITRIGKADTE